jgi:hypothetical protein
LPLGGRAFYAEANKPQCKEGQCGDQQKVCPALRFNPALVGEIQAVMRAFGVSEAFLKFAS